MDILFSIYIYVIPDKSNDFFKQKVATMQNNGITAIEIINEVSTENVEPGELRSEEAKELVANQNYKTDCRLLICLLFTFFILVSSGGFLIFCYVFFADSIEAVKPVVVIGAVLLGAGGLVICFMLEISFKY